MKSLGDKLVSATRLRIARDCLSMRGLFCKYIKCLMSDVMMSNVFYPKSLPF